MSDSNLTQELLRFVDPLDPSRGSLIISVESNNNEDKIVVACYLTEAEADYLNKTGVLDREVKGPSSFVLEWNEQQAILIAEAIIRYFRLKNKKPRGFGK